MIYRIEVKVVSGAWFFGNEVSRVLDIPGTFSLYDLCVEILNSLDFDFDHLFAFTIRKRSYEGQPFGGSPECEEVTLDSLQLRKGAAFSLWYDFGDDWKFNIKILEKRKESKESSEQAKLVSKRGTVEQYPAFEEDEEDENFDGDDFPEEIDELYGRKLREELASPDAFAEYSLQDIWSYRPADSLFDAAFSYKKTKLWNRLYDNETFGIRFSDGTAGMAVIMGRIGQHCALAVYLEGEGIDSYLHLYFGQHETQWYMQEEQFFLQNCLQLVFDSREYLNDEELQWARKYADAKGIRFSGKNAFPHFQRFSPYCFPWHPVSEKEEMYLREAAEAAVYVSGLLGKKKPETLGIRPVSEKGGSIPRVSRDDTGWHLDGQMAYPAAPAIDWPRPDPHSDVKLAKIRKWKASGTLEVRICMYPQPVTGEEDGIPYYPMMLMGLYTEKKIFLPPGLTRYCPGYEQKLLDSLLDCFISLKWRPSVIHVTDERTYAALDKTAAALKSVLKMVPDSADLDEMAEDMATGLNGGAEWDEEDGSPEISLEELISMVDVLLLLPDEAFPTMPDDLRESLEYLLTMDILPKRKARQLRKKLAVKR